MEGPLGSVSVKGFQEGTSLPCRIFQRVPPIVGIESGEDFSLYTVIKTFVIKEVFYAGNPPLLPES